MLSLDIHTMQCLFIGICFAIAIAITLVAEKDGSDGLLLWAVALCFNAVAYVIWLLQSVSANILTVPLTEGIGSITYATFCLAICRFLKRELPLWHITVLPGIVFFSCLLLKNDPELLIIAVKTILLFQAGYLWYHLKTAKLPFASNGRYLTLFGIGIVVILNLLRILAAIKEQFYIAWGISWQDLTTIPFVLVFFSAIFASCGFLLMSKERSDTILKNVAMRDRLTQCWNRIRIDEVAEQELARLDRYGYPVTLIIADIDFFKKVNDTFGHQAGDDVLCDFAEISRKTLRTTDFLGRWGGEEFIAILPSTSFSDATRIAERWRQALAQHTCPHGEPVTASFGIATARSTDSWSDWLERADQALYAAKDAGRNCCKFENINIARPGESNRKAPPVQIRWGDEYETGYEQIDLQHREIIRQVNTLLDIETSADIYPLVLHILEMTRHHFSCEISHLEKEKSSAVVLAHKDFHDYLLQRAESLLRKARQGEADPETLTHFIVFELVVQHMMGEDLNVMRKTSGHKEIAA